MRSDPLGDARLLHERSLAHIADYSRLAGNDGGLWRVASSRDGDAFTTTLILDRAALHALKPIIADTANNLIHALDLVAAAAYRASANGRPRNFYFPIAADDHAYARKSAALGKLLDRQWLDLFAALRDRHKPYQGYLELLKVVSTDANHWYLGAAGAGAAAVAWTFPATLVRRLSTSPRIISRSTTPSPSSATRHPFRTCPY